MPPKLVLHSQGLDKSRSEGLCFVWNKTMVSNFLTREKYFDEARGKGEHEWGVEDLVAFFELFRCDVGGTGSSRYFVKLHFVTTGNNTPSRE